MVTMAQRIEALRTEAGLARVPASLELGFPKNAFEKFETGRQTPTKEQQEKLASYLGVPSQGQLRILRIGRCCIGSPCLFLYALFVMFIFPITPISV